MDVVRLFEEHNEALCRYLFRLTGDADVAADAAQEAFVRLLERPPRTVQPRAWLYTVATNVVRDQGRARSRRWLILMKGGDRVPYGDAPRDPMETLEADEVKVRVRHALQELSEKERTALLLREEGFSQREIAETVGTTTKSVGTLIARALRKLARRFEHESEVES
jgi:RNA polymerase sigma factor (sigma-70 family)